MKDSVSLSVNPVDFFHDEETYTSGTHARAHTFRHTQTHNTWIIIYIVEGSLNL